MERRAKAFAHQFMATGTVNKASGLVTLHILIQTTMKSMVCSKNVCSVYLRVRQHFISLHVNAMNLHISQKKVGMFTNYIVLWHSSLFYQGPLHPALNVEYLI